MDKIQLTQILMKEAKLENIGIHKCKWKWWKNPDNLNSWSLTYDGYELMIDLGIESTMHTVKNSMSRNQTFLLLDKYLSTPFYIQRIDRIAFFGGQDSIMLTLLDNNLDQYIENFKR